MDDLLDPKKTDGEESDSGDELKSPIQAFDDEDDLLSEGEEGYDELVPRHRPKKPAGVEEDEVSLDEMADEEEEVDDSYDDEDPI